MNESLIERKPSPAMENAEVLTSPERLDSSEVLSAIFAHIKDSEGKAGHSFSQENIQGMAERVGADTEQIEAAKNEIGFTEQAAAIADKKKSLKERFRENVTRSLLPVFTAVTMSNTPVLAQESDSDRPKAKQEAAFVVKSESRELTKESLFDLNSPLAIVGKKMEKLRKEMSTEELALVQDFYKKAWREKNEWVVAFGKDKEGNFLSETQESGSLGGTHAFDIREKITQDGGLMHTHPVMMMESGLGSVAEAVRNGDHRPFLLTPSAVDIGQCMDDAESVTDKIQRVVDPRGVWEYKCDERHPFIAKRKEIKEGFEKNIERIMVRHGIEQEDFQRTADRMGNVHPMFLLTNVFSELDKKYPGLEQNGHAVISKFISENNEWALDIMSYEEEGLALSKQSLELPDTELAKKIQSFVTNAEKRGIYMSFTPFKTVPEKNRKDRE